MRELAMEYRRPQFSREFVDPQQRIRGDLITRIGGHFFWRADSRLRWPPYSERWTLCLESRLQIKMVSILGKVDTSSGELTPD
jgi:hypothetical protein